MPSANRDILLQGLSFFLAGVPFPIPLGGGDESAKINPGELATTERGALTSIKKINRNPDHKLVITCYPEDPATPVLRALQLALSAPGATALPLSGTALNIASGEQVSWADCTMRMAGGMPLGSGTATQTYEFDLIDAVFISL